MAALPSPTQVAGSHYGTYEAYYRLVDPNNTGSVGAGDAAKFLKKSGLSDVVLSKIWDLSDPAGKGYLYKQGFFVALKLVSMAQAGHPVSMEGISADLPPPKMGDLKVKPVVNSTPASAPPAGAPGKGPAATAPLGDWSIKAPERAKYEQLFDSLQPVNGKILGNKVKGVLMESKLPLKTLGTIWDLADMDKDGQLDKHEFMVAMHLVYKALANHAIPNVLPAELLPPGKRKPSHPGVPPVHPPPPAVAAVSPLVSISNAVGSTAPVVPPPPTIASSTIPIAAPLSAAPPLPAVSAVAPVPWVVSAEERVKYSELFTQTDIDKDGFVSGHEIKHVFLSSGVPQHVLANIWGLCDTKQQGKLNNEQFALAMWLINQKLKGLDPPKALTPEMVPPCMRAKSEVPVETVAPTPYSNPELDMIQKDIEELSREKRQLETDITQKEADIKLKSSEVKSLQSELDTLAATLRQLETQKGEAQKRLGDLKTQMSTVETELSKVLKELEEENKELENLRTQTAEQEATLKAQEDDLVGKKQELEGLKQEEARLAAQQESFRERLDSLTKNLQDSQLHISQAKAKISLLQEQRRQMTDAIAMYDTAINTGDASGVPDWSFNLEPEFRDPEIKRLTMVNGDNPSEEKDGVANGPHGKKEKKATSLFDDDVPFPVTKATNDPFASDPFSSAFDSKPMDGFVSDPFNSFNKSSGKADPFGSDPFGDSRGGAKTPDMMGKDPFGCDPFSALRPPPEGSAPPPRPESPSPALPPKKSKQPPPRPAPPRPSQGPKLSATPSPAAPTPSPDPSADPFGGGGGGGGFADFANFDSKYCPSPAPTFTLPRQQAAVRTNQFSSLPRPRGIVKQIGDPLDSGSEFSQSSTAVSQRMTSPATSSVTSATESTNRYAAFEFTEDPFRNYRYEDPFNIADPFSDDDNGNKTAKSGVSVDPFGMSTSSSPSHDERFAQPITDDSLFDDNFAQSESFQVGSKIKKDRTLVLDDLSNNNSRSEKSDPFRVISDQSKAFGDSPSNKPESKKHSFWSKQSGSSYANKSKKSSLFSHKTLTPNGSGGSLSEDQQLSWAARESLRLEEERKQRQEQENAELALALELSRQEAGGHH